MHDKPALTNKQGTKRKTMKDSFKEIEPARYVDPNVAELNSNVGDRHGAFSFTTGGVNTLVSVLVDTKLGWEHVSVSGHKRVKQGSKVRTVPYTPSWEEMQGIKDMFFKKSETVIQIHPEESQSASAHDNTLHLWRPVDQVIPLPPQELVAYSDEYFKPVEDAQPEGEPESEDNTVDSGDVVPFE